MASLYQSGSPSSENVFAIVPWRVPESLGSNRRSQREHGHVKYVNFETMGCCCIVFSPHMPHFSGHTHARRDHRDTGRVNGQGQFDRELAVPVAHAPTHDEIAALAYSYWESRGRQGGSPSEDWFRAERELLAMRLG